MNKLLRKYFSQRSVYKGKWLELIQDDSHSRNLSSDFIKRNSETVSPDHSGVVSISLLPNDLTTLGELSMENLDIILIENLRIPSGRHILESPAGLCDKEFSIEENAMREVQEETGYRVKKIVSQTKSPKLSADPHHSTEEDYCVVSVLEKPSGG